MDTEDELEMVKRHVRQGAAIVVRQRTLVGSIQEEGRDAKIALAFLAQFENLQHQHEEHLARLEAKGMTAPPS